MATAPIPAPDMMRSAEAGAGQQPGQGGPGPGGGFVSTGQPQEDPVAAQLLRMSLGIVANARMIATKVPGASDEVRQINDLVAKIQGKIKGGQPAPQSMAPPV
jgi:hypothetical protein